MHEKNQRKFSLGINWCAHPLKVSPFQNCMKLDFWGLFAMEGKRRVKKNCYMKIILLGAIIHRRGKFIKGELWKSFKREAMRWGEKKVSFYFTSQSFICKHHDLRLTQVYIVTCIVEAKERELFSSYVCLSIWFASLACHVRRIYMKNNHNNNCI